MTDKKRQFKKGTSPWNKGKKMTLDYCQKVSETLKGLTGEFSRRWKGGFDKKKYYKKWLEMNKKKCICGNSFSFNAGQCQECWLETNKGDKHYNWKGGKSFEPYSIDWTETLRRSIRERDKYICQLCNLYGNTIHHIDYDKKNCSPNNLINLCIACNSKVNFNRDYWINYFKK